MGRDGRKKCGYRRSCSVSRGRHSAGGSEWQRGACACARSTGRAAGSVGRCGTWRRNLRGERKQASGRTMGAHKQQRRRGRSLQIQDARQGAKWAAVGGYQSSGDNTQRSTARLGTGPVPRPTTVRGCCGRHAAALTPAWICLNRGYGQSLTLAVTRRRRRTSLRQPRVHCPRRWCAARRRTC